MLSFLVHISLYTMKHLSLITFILLSTYASYSQTDCGILKIALSYLDTPYVAHTLERTKEEKLVFNKEEVDCTTYVEYVLAEALAASDTLENRSAQQYLQQIRYRNGEIEGYCSRLHYITEWILSAEANGFVQDITQQEGTDSMQVVLSYMSEHPQYYRHLAHSTTNQEKIRAIEQKISGTKVGWLPQNDLPEQGLSWIKDGDIIALTVGIRGLDVSHLGFAIYVDEQLHLLHASSSQGKVMIEPVPLSQMLQRNKNWNGIRVIRPCLPAQQEQEDTQKELPNTYSDEQ